MNLVSNLPQTGSLERHRILSESITFSVILLILSPSLSVDPSYGMKTSPSNDVSNSMLTFRMLVSGSSKIDSPILGHDGRMAGHKPGESRTSSRPSRPAVSTPRL
jgi:hypothetical protein